MTQMADQQLPSSPSQPQSPQNDPTQITTTTTTQSTATTDKMTTLSYMLLFFLAMIGHELALEAASNAYAHNLDSLASAVTLFQFGFCFGLPVILSNRGEVWETFPKNGTQVLPYVKLSLLVFGATALATQSLSYVSYPTKVVFKSAKLIPTMIVQTVMKKKNNNNKKNNNHVEKRRKDDYDWYDYIAAALICAGAAGYSYGSGSGGEKKEGGDDTNTSYYGIALLTVSILCDALVPNMQQQLMESPPPRHHSSSSSNNDDDDDGEDGSIPLVHPKQREKGLSAAAVMVNVNAVGFSFLLVYMVLSGSLKSTISMALMHPRLVMYLTLVGLGLSTAVFAYTRLIKASGSVVAVAVATLRKVATVLLSYIIFPKPILPIHFVSGLMVLAGVLMSTFRKRSK